VVQVQVSADRHLLLLCADCGDERRFEQPPCEDGHGADCPEWACVDCGAAILLGQIGPISAIDPVHHAAPRVGTPSGRRSSRAQAPVVHDGGQRHGALHRYVA
jgi:hypothetical protein